MHRRKEIIIFITEDNSEYYRIILKLNEIQAPEDMISRIKDNAFNGNNYMFSFINEVRAIYEDELDCEEEKAELIFEIFKSYCDSIGLKLFKNILKN